MPPDHLLKAERELFVRALQQQKNNKLENSIDLWKRFLKNNARSFRAYNNLGMAHYTNDQLLPAILAFEKDKILLFPSELNVSSVGYIGGLGDAIGEWRRRALDLLRELDIDSSSKYLSIMELSMDILSELDYPDGMTGGLRRIADNARAIIERTRSDITNATVQAQLRV